MNLETNKLNLNINKTFELLKNSYSPYSKFRVACSIITKNNCFFGGVNIENSSYGLTICAEKSAMSSYISNGQDLNNIDYIIIVSDCIEKITPCGSCLQFLGEFIKNNNKIITASYDKNINENFNISEYCIYDLLPKLFKL